MATRSTIALEYADGTVDQIYCHWDGYLDNNGQLLYKHYQDPFKVQKLMDLGDLSSLNADIGEAHDFDDRAACEDVCTFYGRDRGETGVGAKRFKDFEDYKKNHQYEEYEYILRTDGHWYVSQYSKDYELLGEAIANELKERADEEEALM
jgi:hypothetical protein